MTNICYFCLKVSNACRSVDETLKETIELLFIHVELVITEGSVICKECIEKLHLAFDVKEASICNEDMIESFETNKTKPEKFIDFYLKRNKMEFDVFPNGLKICRFCITAVAENNFYLLEDPEVDMNVREVINTHLSEVDFTITNNPIVCKICLRKLQDYGMFVNGWLNIYNLKKHYCSSKIKTDNPDLNEVRKFIFGTNKSPQHLDNYDIHSNNIKNEIFTKEFDSEKEGNANYRDCLVDNIQLKDHFEIYQLKDSPEVEQIKTETVCSDVHLRTDVVTMSDDFETEESKQKIEILQFEPKMESVDYFLKEEEISIIDVMDGDDTTDIEEYSDINSDTLSLCNNNQAIGQKYNGYSSPSELKVPIEISNDSKVGSSFSRELFPKKERKRLSLTKKSMEPLMLSKNSAYQPININNGFKCNLCPFQNELEAQVKVHFKNSHSSKKNKLTKQLGDNLSECLYCKYKTNHKENLKNHLTIHFSKTKNNNPKWHDESSLYKCEHCDYKTKFKCYLKGHLILHSDGSQFYNCKTCHFKTKYKSILKNHLKVHSNRDFYKCEHCDYEIKSIKHFNRHLLGHSNIYKCVHCDFITNYRSSLKTHLIMHSNEFYKCQLCDFKTKYESRLKKHLKVHSVGFLYKCEHCDYHTKFKIYFKSHLLAHSVKR